MLSLDILEWGPFGLAHGPNRPQVILPDHGPALMGPIHDLTGLAHAIPTVPTVVHANPTWDWTKHANRDAVLA